MGAPVQTPLQTFTQLNTKELLTNVFTLTFGPTPGVEACQESSWQLLLHVNSGVGASVCWRAHTSLRLTPFKAISRVRARFVHIPSITIKPQWKKRRSPEKETFSGNVNVTVKKTPKTSPHEKKTVFGVFNTFWWRFSADDGQLLKNKF